MRKTKFSFVFLAKSFVFQKGTVAPLDELRFWKNSRIAILYGVSNEYHSSFLNLWLKGGLKHPNHHPHPAGKFQKSKIELYFQNKSC